MHLDEQALFSDGQAITASAASTNYIDLGQPATPPGAPAALKRRVGNGHDIPLIIQVVEDFDNLTSLRVDMQQSDTSDFAESDVVGSSGAVSLADLKAGKRLACPVLTPQISKRYLRLFYTVTGTAPSAGAVTAGVTDALQTNG